jgi:hypothetical protein
MEQHVLSRLSDHCADFVLVHRDPRYFSPNPEDFWPERWLPGEGPKIAEARGQEFELFQGAYMPFHYGLCPKFPSSQYIYHDAYYLCRPGELCRPPSRSA